MNDLISRQDVLDEFLKLSDYLDKDMIIGTYIGLNMLPSVQPKREECEEREQGLCPFYAG